MKFPRTSHTQIRLVPQRHLPGPRYHSSNRGLLQMRRKLNYIKRQKREWSAYKVVWIALRVFEYVSTAIVDPWTCPANQLLQSANGYPSGSPQSSIHSAAPQVDTTRWATAEEEKIRLFTQAQNNARIVQGFAQDLNGGSSKAAHGRMASRDSSRSAQQGVTPGRPPVKSAGAALYSHAMSSVNKPSWGTPVTPSPSVPPPASQTSTSSRLPSAKEEKEMLRRYNNATRAVQRHQEVNFGSSDPDGMMSSGSSSLPHDSSAGPYSSNELDNPSSPAPDELPPPWVPSPEFPQTAEMSEKDRYRIAFEARERAAAAAVQQPAAPPPPASPTTSPPTDYYTATGTYYPGVNGSVPLEETADGLPPPWHPTPPAAQSGLPPHLRARSPPVPPNPTQPDASRMLSAAEEKALLKAMYHAEEQPASSPPISLQGQQEYHSSRAKPSPGKLSPTRTEGPLSRDQRQVAIPASTPPRTPPPLLPRPPASYIQETAEENARLQDELANGQLSPTSNGMTTAMASIPPSVTTPGTDALVLGDDSTFGLLRPTSPFTVDWESISARTPGAGVDASTNGFGLSSPLSPPPRPPKVPLGQ